MSLSGDNGNGPQNGFGNDVRHEVNLIAMLVQVHAGFAQSETERMTESGEAVLQSFPGRHRTPQLPHRLFAKLLRVLAIFVPSATRNDFCVRLRAAISLSDGS